MQRKPKAEKQADMDATMQQAQVKTLPFVALLLDKDDNDMLRTIVLPMEHEIIALKQRIRVSCCAVNHQF